MSTTSSVAAIVEALDVVVSVGGELPPDSLTESQLIAVADALGVLKRQVDAAFAPIAAEVARRSRAELGTDALARKNGFRTPATMISATTGSTVADAIKLMQVGEATAPRMSLSGERLPARHPHVAAALAAGQIGVTASAAIVALLDRVALRADPAMLDAVEERLTEAAPGLTPDQLSRLLAQAEAFLDPDGVEPREQDRISARSLTFRERDGMIHITGVLDPEAAAPVLSAVRGIVTATLRRNEHDAAPSPDDRSVRQMQADALSDLCRHAMGCTNMPTLPTATVVIRMNLSDLQEGIGTGAIDGIDQPISAAAVRRMAVDAEVIPCVLGGDSEILDWGRRKRLFTAAQKLALVERDGGCAHCGAPPHLTVGHHILWWLRDAGPTDLENGVLLCVACHTRLHADGWEIRVDGPGTKGRVWFIPPAWLDAARTPRLGGRARYDLAS